MTSTDPDRAWIVAYLRHLPPELRPDMMADDPLLKTAGAQARGNGWDAKVMAEAVAKRDYGGVMHTGLLATQRLQAVGSIPPSPVGAAPRWGRGEYRPAHCGRPGCECSHDQGCFRGWVDGIGEPGTTVPCRNCRPVLHLRLRDIPGPGERTEADMAHIRSERGRG